MFQNRLYSTVAVATSSNLTPKGLYKYLLKQCQRLPNPEIQKYYKHQVRQGFNQHSDESEIERVNQIISQAVKDFDWILKKSRANFFIRLLSISTRSYKMNPHKSDSLGSQSERCLREPKIPNEFIENLTMDGQVSSEFQFFYVVSVFATRPHILNRSLKGAQLVESEELGPKFYKKVNNDLEEIVVGEVPPDLYEDLQQPFRISLIDELRDFGVHQMVLTRKYIGHSLKEHIALETWDLKQPQVTIENYSTHASKEFPPFTFSARFVKNSMVGNRVLINVTPKKDVEARSTQASLRIYKEHILPRILKWASVDQSESQGCSSKSAYFLPATSLKYVPVKTYYEQYKTMKDLHFKVLQSRWTETTDPVKFNSEEIGIAAYIKAYLDTTFQNRHFSFVDMGCGNGVLTYVLTTAGASGYGFDIRPRKLWDVFEEIGSKPDLRIQSFNPFSDSIEPAENLWLIGNHPDELTPWISVVARRSNAAGFIVIPCCLFDFHGKFQRKAKNASDSKSLYHNYIHYVAEIGKKCGYKIYIDKLRIPSTKRVCIIGVGVSSTANESDAKCINDAIEYANSKISEFPSTDESIRNVPIFQPRNPVERVNNCTQIDKTVIFSIVERIFKTIMSDEHRDIVSHPQFLRPWNRGLSNLTLNAAAKLLTSEEKEIIKSQGRGLQTILKNHHQIFRIQNSCVILRRPLIDSNRNPSQAIKAKTQPCYFNLHHPDGCPLSSSLCGYKHCDELVDAEETSR